MCRKDTIGNSLYTTLPLTWLIPLKIFHMHLLYSWGPCNSLHTTLLVRCLNRILNRRWVRVIRSWLRKYLHRSSQVWQSNMIRRNILKSSAWLSNLMRVLWTSKEFYNPLGRVPNRCSSSICKTRGLLSFSRGIGWEGSNII